MLAKKQRLAGKEVRFLTKKRQVYSRGIFTIYRVEQYQNRPFHQIAFHIPLAVSKRAVQRHKVKRMLIANYEKLLNTIPTPLTYFKGFITLHKLKLEKLITLLVNKDDIALKTYLEQEFQSAFIWFFLHNDHKQSKHPQKPRKHCSSVKK